MARPAIAALAVCAAGAFCPPAAGSDFVLTFDGTSFRDYYCGVTLSMKNNTSEPLTEINGFVASMVDGVQIGRSRGASFTDLAPGESGQALFESPNVPCDTATEYVFMVGACRFDATFSNKEICSERILGTAPVAPEAVVK